MKGVDCIELREILLLISGDELAEALKLLKDCLRREPGDPLFLSYTALVFSLLGRVRASR